VGFETVVDFAREAIDDAETDCLTCGYADEGRDARGLRRPTVGATASAASRC